VNRSFNTWLRNTKSLFSSAIINKPNFGIKVPKFKVPDGQKGEREAYWFETVDFEKAGSMKFQAPVGITYEDLVRKRARSCAQRIRSVQAVSPLHVRWPSARRSRRVPVVAVEAGRLFHPN